MTFGALAFLSPWLLTGLAALPLIYWLLRTSPPRPRQVTFPATRILVGLENREKTPAKTPWWLLLLRLLAAALVIFALADPILNPERRTTVAGDGPLVIVVDNGWAAAPNWEDRKAMIERLITTAETSARPVVILPTATHSAQTPKIEAPAQARNTARALIPEPFKPNRASASTALETILKSAPDGVSIFWLTDGIDHTGEGGDFAKLLAASAKGGTFAVVTDPLSASPLGLEAKVAADGGLNARIVRTGGTPLEGRLDAYSARSELLGAAPFRFSSGQQAATASFDLPLELRNQVTRIAISDQQSAGAVSLLDARARRQRVGLISGESREQSQPLLAPFYYIEKALGPTAEIVKPADKNIAAGIEAALQQNASVLVLADIGTLPPSAYEDAADWVDKGGLLIRFAGPRLEKGGDDLLPVPLRIGGRTLGGALSWSTPQKLADFDDNSLFAGLAVPADVTIRRQVLADPSRISEDISVWARLQDGTPLVTAAKRGDGLVVLFHITGNTDWSNVPISGLFVEMLNRIVGLGRLGGPTDTKITGSISSAKTAGEASVLSPFENLDGYGQPGPPPPNARAIPAGKFSTVKAGPDHPPGYYGAAGAPRALNVIEPGAELKPLPTLPSTATRLGYTTADAQPIKPWLLAAATGLILIDMIAVLLMQGLAGMFGSRRPAQANPSATSSASRPAGIAVAILATGLIGSAGIMTAPNQAAAQALNLLEKKALQATADVTFGYVLTGDKRIDDTSRIGLAGLSRVLKLRTAVIPGDPIAVDVINDEISFFPVLYWPIEQNARPLPEKTLSKIDAYMKQGGMIIFDTRNQGSGMPSGLPTAGRAQTPLQAIIGKLDLPRLEPVPEGHVLTKSFYLLRQFPGRWDGGQLWVEAGGVPDRDGSREARRADGVTSILITSNDFASAWALDPRGRPLFPTVPGGEIQREMAFRTGINIVMHALTGNYKADQVHVPALLERLGQ
ncbi:MAG: DUF4159 domain-containing protein [Alphaproteobacteria bacterium]|nr:DUF4159 domain-containing protein [Alphaproteobacteria bacterium]